MIVDRHTVARKLLAYLRHEIALTEIVDWAECAMADAEFAEADLPVVRDVVARLGLADVRAFGLLTPSASRSQRGSGGTDAERRSADCADSRR